MIDHEKRLKDSVESAQTIVDDSEAVSRLADQAHMKARRAEKQLKGIRKDFDTLVRMMRASASRKYKDMGVTSILIVIGAVIYFVNPIDAIPDFLPLFGLTDDLSVIAFAISRVRKEIDRFREWENEVDMK
jgi:uncharacterized membrane protein YkvA (DUF1232 family)